MEESLSGTLAIDLGNTNTVIAFQDQKDINSVLVEIPNITSTPGVIPTAVWYEEPSKILKINEQLEDIKIELMDEESIFLELEKLPWYIELEGNKEEWSLRFVFESQDQTRSFEMYWPCLLYTSPSPRDPL